MLSILLNAIAFLGHAAIWIAVWNRLHALPVHHRLLRIIDKVLLVVLLLPLVLVGLRIRAGSPPSYWHTLNESWPAQAYRAVGLLFWAIVMGRWFHREFLRGAPDVLRSDEVRVIRVDDQVPYSLLGGFKARCLSLVPENQMLELAVHRKELLVPSLPRALDGFTIAHLSDLHFTGQIREEFFHVVIDHANDFEADLVAITGDIIDRVHCLEWIGRTLGRLRSRHGVYCILGNHDYRLPDVGAVRSAIDGAGLVRLAGCWTQLPDTSVPVLLAGNEEPWAKSKPDLRDAPPGGPDGLFRILLAHSPDQLGWARRNAFDLMLAGHTHGGQIRLPLVGPIVAPSLHGVRYASGTFWESPTIMHVSRGISGLDLVRINCRPELALLTLRRDSGPDEAAER